ncbi:MAG: hypothetical protein JWO78_1319 [Micavibrio sp.]|nr:hypothetical protein [Micavibrio sp.]
MIIEHAGKTEAQLRATSMMLTLALALMDEFPGRVTISGTLWENKVYVRINDLEHLVFDFTGGEGIRTYMIRSTDTSDGGQDVTPIADFKVNPAASLEGVQAYIKDLVVITADALVISPVDLVHKIAAVASDPTRL